MKCDFLVTHPVTDLAFLFFGKLHETCDEVICVSCCNTFYEIKNNAYYLLTYLKIGFVEVCHTWKVFSSGSQHIGGEKLLKNKEKNIILQILKNNIQKHNACGDFHKLEKKDLIINYHNHANIIERRSREPWNAIINCYLLRPLVRYDIIYDQDIEKFFKLSYGLGTKASCGYKLLFIKDQW